MERALKKKKRSHSANPENRNQSDSSDSANQGTINRLSSQPRGTVVISRKSREKGKNLKISDDDSAKISDDSALSPDLSRESSTSSSFDSDASGVRRSTRSRLLRDARNRKDEIQLGSSSDEKNSPTHISSRQSRDQTKLKKRKERPSTLPSRCDPAMLNQWAKAELEQGIMI